jgi:hypothetical protein
LSGRPPASARQRRIPRPCYHDGASALGFAVAIPDPPSTMDPREQPPATPTTITVPLRSRRARRARAVRGAQDLVPAGALFIAGAQSLLHGESGTGLALAIAEVVTSVFLIFHVVRTLRALRTGAPAATHGHHATVDWGELWAGLMLAAEAWEHWHNGHHVKRPTILLSAVTILIGLNHRRLTQAAHRWRALTLSESHLSVGGPPWRRFRAKWADVVHVEITPLDARLAAVGGAHRRIIFADLENADEVRAVLETARGRLLAPAR